MSEIKRGADCSAQHTGCAGAKPATEQSERRGAVLLIQSGDPEISRAIAEGIVAGRREATAAAGQATRDGTQRESAGRARTSSVTASPCHLPQRGRHTAEQRRVGEAKIDRQAVARLVKVAVGNTKGAEDYAILRAAAAQEYRMPKLTELARVREKLLAIYAMTVYRLHEYFRRERKSATSGQHIWLCGRVAATGRHGLGQPTDWEGSRWRGK